MVAAFRMEITPTPTITKYIPNSIIKGVNGILTVTLFVNTIGSCLAKNLFRDWVRTDNLARCRWGGRYHAQNDHHSHFLGVGGRISK